MLGGAENSICWKVVRTSDMLNVVSQSRKISTHVFSLVEIRGEGLGMWPSDRALSSSPSTIKREVKGE
jgi:hypothetical protein